MSQPTNITNPGAVQQYGTGAPPGGGDGAAPPVDCCETDEENVPNRAEDATTTSLSPLLPLDRIQSAENSNTNTDPFITTDWDVPTTAGTRLFAAYTERNGTPGFAATPGTGWDLVGYFEWVGFDQGASALWTRVAVGGDPSVTVTKTTPRNAALAIWEVSGVGDQVDVATVDTSAADAASVGPADVDDDDSYAVGFFAGGTEFTEGVGWDGFEDGLSGGIAPGWFVEDATVDTPDATATAVVLNTSGIWGGLVATYAPGGEPAWIVLEPRVTDGDDATYEDVTGPEHLRLDLGAEYRITRARIRLGTTTAGSKTLTLKAWNELDESDTVTVTSTTFTGLGTLTAQDVEWSWLTSESYRYWQVDGPAEVVRWFSVELYEPTLSESHGHPANLIDYDNTDSGLTADNVQDAIDELDAALDAIDPTNATSAWMPLTTVVGGVPELVWDANNSLIPTLVPLE